MSQLGKLIEAYQDQHGTSDRALALRIGVSGTLIGRWKAGKYQHPPKKELLQALADQIGVSYRRVVDAAVEDTLFREEVARDGAPMNVTPLSAPEPKVRADELAGLPSVAHKPRKPKGRTES